MYDYQLEGSEEEDRLGELPKSLLFQILSLLPMRDVVRTALLSKSWEDLWTTVPCLNFCDDNSIESFRDFVNRALILWKGIQILKFEIVIESHFNMSLAGDMDLWVKFAVKNEVQELNIVLSWVDDGEDVYMAPLRLSSCSSIKKLSLVGCSVRIHGSPAWNQLKFLKMHGCYLSGQFISQILLGTPHLEVFDLQLRENNEDLNIQSASLKELRIEKYLIHNGMNVMEKPSIDAVLEICCPNLEAFEIAGVPYFNFLLTNVPSLTRAKILDDCPSYWFEHGDELLGETLGQILRFIQHAEKVTLSAWCIEVLGASSRKYLLSPLLNFKYLELVVLGRIGLGVIVNLLGFFPNIKMLVIEDYHNQFDENAPGLTVLEFETNTSKPFLGQLKTIEIHSFLMCPSSFRFIKFLLKHACMLEKLVVCDLHSTSYMRDSFSQTHFLEVAKVLLNMPRSSPTAEVVFKTK